MTDKMRELFMRQIQSEIGNSIIYRNISNFLSLNGLDNLSKTFKEYSQHEMDHSWKLQEFLEKINEKCEVYGVSVENEEINLTNFAAIALQLELNTTTKLNEMLQESYEAENSVIITEFLLSEMINEQIEETDKSNKLNDQIKNLSGDIKFLQLFNNTFGEK